MAPVHDSIQTTPLRVIGIAVNDGQRLPKPQRSDSNRGQRLPPSAKNTPTVTVAKE